jgi:ssDNA-binding replication factor A large subunit
MQRKYGKHGFFSFSDSGVRELSCVRHDESEINTVCRVLEIARKEIRTKGGDKRGILHGIVADDTAKLLFVSSEEREELVKDKVVLIENAYVKRWRGLPTLYAGKNTNVREIEEDISFPSYAELIKPRKRSIAEIVRCEGAFDVIVEGEIVSILEEADKRVPVLDDGKGAVYLVSRGREMEERISFGLSVRARGNVVDSEKGYALMAEEVEIRGEEFILNEIKNFLCKYT